MGKKILRPVLLLISLYQFSQNTFAEQLDFDFLEDSEVVKESADSANDIQGRLAETGAISFEEQEYLHGARLEIHAKNLGTIEKSIIEKKDKTAQRELANFLSKNELIVGKRKDYYFEISEISSLAGAIYVRFNQVIDGLSLPESSLRFREDGTGVSLILFTSEPENPIFDRASWLNEAELTQQLKTVVESRLGTFDESELLSKVFYILPSKEAAAFAPVMSVEYGSYLIRINVLTGDVYSFDSLVSSYRIPFASFPFN